MSGTFAPWPGGTWHRRFQTVAPVMAVPPPGVEYSAGLLTMPCITFDGGTTAPVLSTSGHTAPPTVTDSEFDVPR